MLSILGRMGKRLKESRKILMTVLYYSAGKYFCVLNEPRIVYYLQFVVLFVKIKLC